MLHKEIVEDMTGECEEDYCSLEEIWKLSGLPREEISHCGGCKGNGGDCPLKTAILKSGLDDRTLEQFKCIEIFKFENGIPRWDDALKEWTGNGYHTFFREVYHDGMKHLELYDNIMKYVPIPA
jgi:hypothetical protein